MKQTAEDKLTVQGDSSGLGGASSSQPLCKKSTGRVLFLATEPPETIKAEWPPYQNWFLPQLIEDLGAEVDIRSWRDTLLNAATVSEYSKVTFLWCNDYHEHPKEFPEFVREVLLPAKSLNPNLHIFNDPEIILWNTDKHYLLDLAEAGFRVPKTRFVDVDQISHASLMSIIGRWTNPVVLKPAISGSARNTHLIMTPGALTSKDLAFLDHVIADGTHGDLILQEYECGITSGEYSLMFIHGKHTHTVLKIPQAGEFRINGEFGGHAKEITGAEIPTVAVEAAEKVVEYLEDKFGNEKDDSASAALKKLVYTRIDGVMHDDTFVLMEVEAIEPHMWLEKESGASALDELRKVFLQAEQQGLVKSLLESGTDLVRDLPLCTNV